MTALAERVNTPVSTAELERRWEAVRKAMAADGIDVLVMQSNNSKVGGYGKYFTDIPVYGYFTAVVFPAVGPMTVVTHGPIGGERELPSEGDGVWRGVGRILNTAAFPSAVQCDGLDAPQVLRALRGFERSRIGLLGQGQMNYALGKGLEEGLPDAVFVDASDLVDRIKAVKSPEEKNLIRRCAQLQDEAMAEVAAAIAPGMKDHDVVAVARAACERRGAEDGVYICGSAPPGEPSTTQPPHLRNRVIEPGDVVALLIESNGPGGMYTELGRTFVLGEVPDVLHEELEFAIEAQRFTVDMLRPGASPAQIWTSYNAFMRDNDRSPEMRLHAHGQGYDLVERPLIRDDEAMALSAGMNLVVHPNYVRNGYLSWICDNWLLDDDGPGDRIHAFPQEIVAV